MTGLSRWFFLIYDRLLLQELFESAVICRLAVYDTFINSYGAVISYLKGYSSLSVLDLQKAFDTVDHQRHSFSMV